MSQPRPLVLGIAGGSGSGKYTLVELLRAGPCRERVAVLRHETVRGTGAQLPHPLLAPPEAGDVAGDAPPTGSAADQSTVTSPKWSPYGIPATRFVFFSGARQRFVAWLRPLAVCTSESKPRRAAHGPAWP